MRKRGEECRLFAAIARKSIFIVVVTLKMHDVYVIAVLFMLGLPLFLSLSVNLKIIFLINQMMFSSIKCS